MWRDSDHIAPTDDNNDRNCDHNNNDSDDSNDSCKWG